MSTVMWTYELLRFWTTKTPSIAVEAINRIRFLIALGEAQGDSATIWPPLSQ